MKKVIDLLNKELNNKDKVIVSCSGGPDSMCLLYLVNELKEKLELDIICVHANHNVREESTEEEEFVRNYCLNENITFELLSILEYKDNFHNDARVQRFEFIKKVASKYNANVLMTAHHGDDLIESILMKIARGSNLTGYVGFKVINNLLTLKTIKPLIYVTKKDILEFNHKNNIEYRVDKTNTSNEYTRNRYRNNILPLLKEENENIHLKYLKFSEKLIEYDEFVKDYILNKNLIEENKIDTIKYLKEDKFIRNRVIESLISITQEDNEFYVTDNIIFEIDKAIISDKGKLTIDLPNGFKGIKENKRFYIKKDK